MSCDGETVRVEQTLYEQTSDAITKTLIAEAHRLAGAGVGMAEGICAIAAGGMCSIGHMVGEMVDANNGVEKREGAQPEAVDLAERLFDTYNTFMGELREKYGE